jgi:hypothetical protein
MIKAKTIESMCAAIACSRVSELPQARPAKKGALFPTPSRRIRKKEIGNPHRNQKREHARADRVLPTSIAISEGYSNYGEESRDQTEHHVGEKSNKPFDVAYSFFQVSRVADFLVASVADCPGVLDHQPSWSGHATPHTVRHHKRSLHLPQHQLLS